MILYSYKNNLILPCPVTNVVKFGVTLILMATSEDDLQTVAHHLNLIARKYKMTISSEKTKPMAMWRGTAYRG
jgi:predicted Co/Zn/Cd cation transporter (cation efflux family)